MKMDLTEFNKENKGILNDGGNGKKAGRNPIAETQKRNKIVSVYLTKEEFQNFEISRGAIPRSAFLYNLLKKEGVI